ncbi:MAG TPA: protein-export chaperone SecB [Gammaproteobacteria bacterium]
MSENEKAQQDGPQFVVQRVYTKDISFETPNSPAIFTEKWEPKVNVELNTTGNKLGDNVYEVVLSLTVTAMLGDKTAYLAEVQQAGVFTLSGFNEQEMGGMIHSYCPNTLFPYVREVVSDLVAKGSFPQMVLQPINFDAIYAQHLKQQAGEQQPEQDPVH